MTEVWPLERPRGMALLRQLEGWDEEEDKEEGGVPIVRVIPSEVTSGQEGTEAASPERECAPRRKRVRKV